MVIKKKIGEILVDSGLVSNANVEKALQNKRPEQRIGDYLIEHGYVKEELMYEKLSKQAQVTLIRLSEIEIKQNALDIVESKEVLNKYTCFPIELSGSVLTLAMENPIDEVVVKELEDVLSVDILPVFGIKSEILDYISKYFDIDDSMSKFFGYNEDDSRDVNEIQVSESLFSYLKDNLNHSVVILESYRNVEIIHGNLNFIVKKEYKYFLEFIKKISGYSVDDNKDYFEVIINYNENAKIKISLKVINRKTQFEFWINSLFVEGEDVDDMNVADNINIIKGINVLLNPGFESTLKLQKSLGSINKEGERVLVHTDDLSYEKYGLKYLNVRYEDLPDFKEFGDIFVLDYGWEVENVSPLLRLLRADKKVILNTPFKDEEAFLRYLKHIKVESIISEFIKGYLKF